MSELNNWARWYRTGTVNVTQNSREVVGSGTYWLSASLHAGDTFTLDGAQDYEVGELIDDTHIKLTTPYLGKDATGQTYMINRSFTATTGAEVAAEAAGLVQKMTRYVDLDMEKVQGLSAYEVAKAGGYGGTQAQWLQSLVGKSAYEVAVAGGYKGTSAEWLESLKAAGEWSKLDSRTKFIEEAQTLYNENSGYSGFHNSIVRGKYLGDKITDEQWAAIANKTYTDMYLGDYWEIRAPLDFVNSGQDSEIAMYYFSQGWHTATERTIRWHIAAFDYIHMPSYYDFSTYGVLLLGLIRPYYPRQDTRLNESGSFMINGPDHEPNPNDISGGFAGTDMYTRVLPSLQNSYKELWGEDHLMVCPYDYVSSDVNGGKVKNELAITLPPLRMFQPEASNDLYPLEGFKFPIGTAIRNWLFRRMGGAVFSRNISKSKTSLEIYYGRTDAGEYRNMPLYAAGGGTNQFLMLIK